MYVHGIPALFRFEGYVVQKMTMRSEIVQVTLGRDGRRVAVSGRWRADERSPDAYADVPRPADGHGDASCSHLPGDPGPLPGLRRILHHPSRRHRQARTRHPAIHGVRLQPGA